MVTNATLDPAQVAARLEAVPPADLDALVEEVFASCRALYAEGRSDRGLVLANRVRDRLEASGDRRLLRRANVMCGLMAADAGDLVGAIDFYVQGLRLAIADDDRAAVNMTWSNIGGAFGLAGAYENSMRCYRRALEVPASGEEARRSAVIANTNLAQCCYHLGRMEEGVRYIDQAIAGTTAEIDAADLTSAAVLRRNAVRLLVAVDRIEEAEKLAAAAAELAERAGTKRAHIAAQLARASVELARGRTDVGLTRLDHCLEGAREVPAATRDALACIVRAEEQAGHPARALMRLEELSELTYRSGVEAARRQIVNAGFRDAVLPFNDTLVPQARAKLQSSLDAPMPPENWGALKRLSASAVLRIDASGFHGMRVGALSRMLAIYHGLPPLQATEIGYACELHDIGMLSIPEGILAKRGMLNPAERSIVARHANAGADMLCDDQHARMLLAREVALYHHARWDGTGHPQRVGGDFIPLAARICAVADAYDAMIAGICGFEPRRMQDALQELSRNAGTQFDPELVAEFDEMIRSEMEGRGVDLGEGSGMKDFQELIQSLTEDRGFV